MKPSPKHRSPASQASCNPAVKVSPKQQAILNAVKTVASRPGQQQSHGDATTMTADRQKVLIMCGYTKGTAGGFNFQLSVMKTKRGFLTFDAKSISLTTLGQELAQVDPNHNVAASNEAHWEKCMARIPGKKGKLLFAAMRDGKVHSRASLASAAGYDDPNAGGYKFATSKLVSTELAEYCTDEGGQPALRLTDEVFPYGRPEEQDE